MFKGLTNSLFSRPPELNLNSAVSTFMTDTSSRIRSPSPSTGAELSISAGKRRRSLDHDNSPAHVVEYHHSDTGYDSKSKVRIVSPQIISTLQEEISVLQETIVTLTDEKRSLQSKLEEFSIVCAGHISAQENASHEIDRLQKIIEDSLPKEDHTRILAHITSALCDLYEKENEEILETFNIADQITMLDTDDGDNQVSEFAMLKIVDSHHSKLHTLREGILRSLRETRQQQHQLLQEVVTSQISLSKTSEIMGEYQILFEAAVREHDRIQDGLNAELAAARQDLRILNENHRQSLEKSAKERNGLIQCLQEQKEAAHKTDQMYNDARALIEELKRQYEALLSREDGPTIIAHQLRQKEMEQVIDQLSHELETVRKDLKDCEENLRKLVSKHEVDKAKFLDAKNSVSQMVRDIECRNNDLQDLRAQKDRMEIENNAAVETLRSDIDALQQQIGALENQRTPVEQELSSLRSAYAASIEAVADLKLAISSAEEAKLNLEMSERKKKDEIVKLKEEMNALRSSKDAENSINAAKINELQNKCTDLQQMIDTRNQAIANEEKMVSALREELSARRSNQNIDVVMDTENSDQVSDVVMQQNDVDRTLRTGPSMNAIGKRPAWAQPAAYNGPKRSSKQITSSIITMRRLSVAPQEDIEMQDPTRAQIPSQHPIDIMDTTSDYGHIRSTSNVRPPGSLGHPSLTTRILKTTTPLYHASPSSSRLEAPVNHMGIRHQAEGSSDNRRQETPGRSNYHLQSLNDISPYNSRYSSPNLSTTSAYSGNHESQDAHASYHEDPVAKAMISGMDKMVQKLNAIHEDLTKSPRSAAYNSRSKTSPSPFKDQPSRRPRETDYNFLMTEIRKTMNSMLGIKQDKDIMSALQKGHFATEEEADEGVWNHEIMTMNFKFMKPYWDNLQHEYNTILTHRFSGYLVDKYPKYNQCRDKVEGHFFQRLKQLRKHVCTHFSIQETEIENAKTVRETDEAKLQSNRRRNRQRRGFERRLDDCNERAKDDPSYIPIAETVCLLGVEGYSSDETCAGGFLVRRKPWRNPDMDDGVIAKARAARRTHNINGNNLPGGRSRERIYHPYPPISVRPAPTGQPINHYGVEWYNGLSSGNKKLLKPAPPVPFEGDRRGSYSEYD